MLPELITCELENHLGIHIGSYQNLPPHRVTDNKQHILSSLVNSINQAKRFPLSKNFRSLRSMINEYEYACQIDLYDPALLKLHGGSMYAPTKAELRIETSGMMVIDGARTLLSRLERRAAKKASTDANNSALVIKKMLGKTIQFVSQTIEDKDSSKQDVSSSADAKNNVISGANFATVFNSLTITDKAKVGSENEEKLTNSTTHSASTSVPTQSIGIICSSSNLI